jgi:hypothetical protein
MQLWRGEGAGVQGIVAVQTLEASADLIDFPLVLRNLVSEDKS